MNFKEKLDQLANEDIRMLLSKTETYGDSRKKRGGIGAAMMLGRKWDRIEIALKNNDYDIFKAVEKVDYLIDDIQDLGCYLWLVRSENLMTVKEDEFMSIKKVVRRDSVNLTDKPTHPYANIGDDEEGDPWKNLATKELLNIGETELREFYGIDVNEYACLQPSQKTRFMTHLKIDYSFLQLKETPIQSLSQIVAHYHPYILQYRDPKTGEIIHVEAHKEGCCDG